MILDRKANIEVRNSSGETPLYIAAKYGHFEAVFFLITRCADLKLALLFAAENGNPQIVSLLLKHGSSRIEKDTCGRTPLCLATKKGNVETIKILLNLEIRYQKSRFNYHLIFKDILYMCCAAATGNREIVELALIDNDHLMNEY